MGNAQSRRAAREQRKKKNSRKYLAAGGAAVVLLAGGSLVYTLTNQGGGEQPVAVSSIPQSCTTAQHVTVATSPTMAEVLRNIPVDASDCISLELDTESDDSDVATSIEVGKDAPNLWIPDSSIRAQMTLKDQAKVVSKIPSLAKTPGIVVSSADDTNYSTWNDALGNNKQVSMGDPKTEAGSFIALVNAASEVGNGKVKADVLATSTGLRAQTIGVDSPAKNSDQLLADVKDGNSTAAIVTESDYYRYLSANDASSLKASVPLTGTAELDYPLYQLATNETNATINAAADKIGKFMESEEGKQALETAGLREASGDPIKSDSVGSIKDLSTKDPKIIAETWRSYAIQSAPMNALVAVDVSGSMGLKISGTNQTRMQVTSDSLMAGSQLFPARDSMGLWIFSQDMSTDADGKELPYKELAPVRGLEDPVNGKTQRQAMQEAMSGVKVDPQKGTALNDTLIAEFKNIKGNYQPDAANVVVLITDGENDTLGKPSTSTEDTIAQIQQAQDPDNPVYFVLIGISEDANMDALNQLADNIGGEAHRANSPSDIQKIFQDSLTSIAQTTSDGQ